MPIALGPRSRQPAMHLPDGLGGTIAGGPMRPVDLMELLGRRTGAGGAVTGVAVAAPAGESIALSDGSEIVFATLGETRITVPA